MGKHRWQKNMEFIGEGEAPRKIGSFYSTDPFEKREAKKGYQVVTTTVVICPELSVGILYMALGFNTLYGWFVIKFNNS